MAKVLLWNSLGTRRRSASDTFLDNGLGRLKAHLESTGHEVLLEDWATDLVYSALCFSPLSRLLRRIYVVIFSQPSDQPVSVSIKLLGASTIPLQWLQSLVQKSRMKSRLKRLAARIAEEKIQTVGIKLWYGEAFAWSKYLTHVLHKRSPETIVIAGGYHATLYEEDVLRFAPFDLAVRGDGEQALSEILSLVTAVAGKPKSEILRQIGAKAIQNTLWRNGEKISLAAKRKASPERKAVPFYGTTPGKVRLHVIVESIGCPWGKCNFCVHPKFYEHYIPRPISELVREMKAMVDQGIGVFRLAGSDTPPAFGARIGQAILDAGLNVIYGMGSRAVSNCSARNVYGKTVDQYETMIRSGLRAVFMGGETGHDGINREVMNKGITCEDLLTSVRAIREAEERTGQKVDVALAFIFPVPLVNGVTLDEVFQRNIELIHAFEPDSVMVTPPGPFKQSRWYLEKQRFGFDFAEDLIPSAMEYEYVLYKPPDLWPKLKINLQGRDFVQVLNECLRFRRAVEDLGIPTDISDEHFLMMRSAGFEGKDGAQTFKRETLLDIVSCDYRRLMEISNQVNIRTRAVAGSLFREVEGTVEGTSIESLRIR
jgi:hypothetical protein